MSAHNPSPTPTAKSETPQLQEHKLDSVNGSALAAGVEQPAAAPVAATIAVPEPYNTRFNNLFTVALVIASTLPVGLGVGAACRPKPIVTSSKSDKHDEPSTQDDLRTAKAVLESRQKADDLFQAGEIELALQLYQSKESAESLRPSDRFSFKLAICHEALGHWEEALPIYRTLASGENPAIRAAALLAQARIGLNRHDLKQAQAVLGELLRLPQESPAIPAAMIHDARFLIAIAGVLHAVHEPDAPARPEESAKAVPPLHNMTWPLITAFDQINQLSEESPESFLITQQIPVDFGDEALLETLCAEFPLHWLAGRAKLAIAYAAQQQGNLTEAATRYDELLGRTSTAVSVIAAYNKGLVQFQLREYRSASNALGRVVDGAPGQDLVIPALILRGRALLELGDYEPAMFDLKRAADIPGSPDDKAWATALSGLAALRMKQPQRAADIMFQRRDRLENSSARTAAAFVISLVRYQSLASPEARDREALFLLRSLAALEQDEHHATESLGSNGIILIGQAYGDLGLPERMVELYSTALLHDSREPFVSEMKFSLAEQAMASGDVESGVTLHTELHADSHTKWAIKSGMRLAQWELSQGHNEACLTLCRDLLKRDTEHSPILRLMGLAYERAGDNAKAAECFAGIAP